MTTQHVVEGRLVVALAGVQALEHEDARQPVLSALEDPRPGGLHGHTPVGYNTSGDLLAGPGVDHRDGAGEDRPGPQYRAVAHPGPLGHDASAADQAVVADHHRHGIGRLQHAADTHPTREVDVSSDLGAGPDGGPCVDHGVIAHIGANVRVAGHHHDSGTLIATPPGLRPGHHPYPALRPARLEGNLVGELKGAHLDGGHLGLAEQQEDGQLQPLVDHHPPGTVGLCHPGLPGVQQVNGGVDGRVSPSVVDRQVGAPGPHLFDLCLEVGHGVEATARPRANQDRFRCTRGG